MFIICEKATITNTHIQYKCYKSCLNVCEIDHDHRSGDCWGFSDTLMTEGWVVARWMGHCDELLMLPYKVARATDCGYTHTYTREREGDIMRACVYNNSENVMSHIFPCFFFFISEFFSGWNLNLKFWYLQVVVLIGLVGVRV